MKYSAIARNQNRKPLVLGLRRSDAAECVGGAAVLDRLIADHGLRVRKSDRRGGADMIDAKELEAAWRRFFDGEITENGG